jgi:hypothetical protein
MAYRYKKLTVGELKKLIENHAKGYPLRKKVYLDDYHYVFQLTDGTLIDEEMLNDTYNELNKEFGCHATTC